MNRGFAISLVAHHPEIIKIGNSSSGARAGCYLAYVSRASSVEAHPFFS